MGLIQQFKNKTLFLDTAPIIYYIEENQQYIEQLDNLFNANNNKLFLFKTSIVSLIEVLIHPLRQNNINLANQYQSILCNSKTLEIIDIDINIALKTAELRARYGIKTPDAIQIATAISSDSNYFITNDLELKKLNAEIQIITLNELT